jgi:hypothetical protein
MATLTCATLRKAPQRICFMVNSANQRSTRLSHEAYLGVKWTRNRERLGEPVPDEWAFLHAVVVRLTCTSRAKGVVMSVIALEGLCLYV